MDHCGKTALNRPPAKPPWLPMTSDRALVCDISHFAKQVPSFPVERTLNLAEVAVHRAATHPRIAWSVLFLKAYALVSAEHAALRRAYVPWPWPHFVQRP